MDGRIQDRHLARVWTSTSRRCSRCGTMEVDVAGTIGGHISVVSRETSGRVNRAFEDVTRDGPICCYGPDVGPWAAGHLELQRQRRPHGPLTEAPKHVP